MNLFTYKRAGAIEEAIGAPGRFIAGGTSLVDLMKYGVENPVHLIDINRLPLSAIESLPDGSLRIGALARNSDMANHPVLKQNYPVLAEAILAGASPQLRNMASIGGIVGVRDRLAYCMSKFAVVGITKAMALDHATDGIRVNCICPGRVETPFVQARLAEYPDPKKAYAEMSATQAVGRMGRPDEIAAAALYLASDEAAFVTGSALIIDGGVSAGK